MTWRLVLGVIFTDRRSLFGAIMIIGLISRPTSWEWLAGGAVMLMAAGAGAHTSLDKRELVVLPSSSRELYRAAWILSAALPLAVLMLGRVVGGVWHGVVSDEGWAFHATPVRVLFDTVCFSLVGAAAAGRPDRYEPAFTEDPKLVPFLLGMLVMAAVPFVVIPWLPDRLSDIPAMAWLVGAAALGVGLSPLLRTPEWHRPESRPASAPESGQPVRPQSAGAPLRTSRLAGIWVPLRDVAAHALVLTVLMLVFTAVLQYMITDVVFWQPFAQSPADLRFLAVIGMLIMFVLGWLPGLGPWIGALKRLPISSRTVALLMSVTPAMTLVMLWSALLIIHVAVAAQWPETFRLGPLMAFIGLASLIDALGTKTGSSRTKYWIGAPVFFVFVFGMGANRTLLTALVDHWAPPLAGLLCLALSWVVNFHTLTRSPASARAFRFGRRIQHQGAR